jgi:hypothetical protein
MSVQLGAFLRTTLPLGLDALAEASLRDPRYAGVP